jgi:hypothetical protein
MLMASLALAVVRDPRFGTQGNDALVLAFGQDGEFLALKHLER